MVFLLLVTRVLPVIVVVAAVVVIVVVVVFVPVDVTLGLWSHDVAEGVHHLTVPEDARELSGADPGLRVFICAAVEIVDGPAHAGSCLAMSVVKCVVHELGEAPGVRSVRVGKTDEWKT